MIRLITFRTSTWRLLPPRLAGGINGSTCAHSSSVRSLGYRSTLRSYRLRFFAVHIGDPSSNQATTLESQMIHWIQFVFGRTLRSRVPPNVRSRPEARRRSRRVYQKQAMGHLRPQAEV